MIVMVVSIPRVVVGLEWVGDRVLMMGDRMWDWYGGLVGEDGVVSVEFNGVYDGILVGMLLHGY